MTTEVGAGGRRAPTRTGPLLVYGILTGVSAVAAGLGVAFEQPTFWLAGGAGAILFAYVGWRQHNSVPVIRQVHAVHHHVSLGDFAAAEHALGTIEPRHAFSNLRRSTAFYRGLVHFRQGRFAAAQTELLRVTQIRGGPLDHRDRDASVPGANAYLALIAAISGDALGVRQRAEAVRAHLAANLTMRANVVLAEALVRWKAGDPAGARTHLQWHGPLLLGNTDARERALVRTLLHTPERPKASVYRLPHRDTTTRGAMSVSAWTAAILPNTLVSSLDGLSLEEPSEAALAAPPSTDLPSPRSSALDERTVRVSWLKRPAVRILGLWCLLIAFFLGAYGALTPNRPPRPEPPPPPVAAPPAHNTTFYLITFGVLAVYGTIMFFVLSRRKAKALRQRQGLMTALAENDLATATALLTTLARSGTPAQAADAHLDLAALAEQRGDFQEARSCLDEAMRRAAAMTGTDARLSTAYGMRAFLEAARGHSAEAQADLKHMDAELSGPTRIALARLRVELATLLKAGRRDAAAKLARSRPADFYLPAATELLCLMLVTVDDPASIADNDLEAIHAEVLKDASSRAWVAALDSALWQDFERVVRERGRVSDMARGD